MKEQVGPTSCQKKCHYPKLFLTKVLLVLKLCIFFVFLLYHDNETIQGLTRTIFYTFYEIASFFWFLFLTWCKWASVGHRRQASSLGRSGNGSGNTSSGGWIGSRQWSSWPSCCLVASRPHINHIHLGFLNYYNGLRLLHAMYGV